MKSPISKVVTLTASGKCQINGILPGELKERQDHRVSRKCCKMGVALQTSKLVRVEKPYQKKVGAGKDQE